MAVPATAAGKACGALVQSVLQAGLEGMIDLEQWMQRTGAGPVHDCMP